MLKKTVSLQPLVVFILCLLSPALSLADLSARSDVREFIDDMNKKHGFKEGELLDKVQSAIRHYWSQREHKQYVQEISRRLLVCTPREKDVMRLMVQGLHNKDIAETLSISPRTVEIHRAHVMEKMEAESLPALVRMMTLLSNFPDGVNHDST